MHLHLKHSIPPDSFGCGLYVCIAPLSSCCQLKFDTGNRRHALTFVLPERQGLRHGLWSALASHAIRITVRLYPELPVLVRLRPYLYSYSLAARAHLNFARDPSQHASLKAEIEAQSSSLYATARLWDDGIIKPTETRDVVGLGLALAARQGRSFASSSPSGFSGTSWNGEGRRGSFGVYRM